jgi:predicted transcriptional regulator
MTNNKFQGFQLPEGAWLPSELIDLLPDLSGSQIKTLIILIYNYTQIGGSIPTSLSDIEVLAGLSRQSVITSLKSLLSAGIIERSKVGQSYIYEPRVKFLDPQVKNIVNKKEESEESNLSDSLSNLTILRCLKSNGIYAKQARQFITDYDQEYIQRHLDYYEFALTAGIARGPGFLNMSIKEDWQQPLGYDRRKLKPDRERYSEWEE